MSLFNHGPQGFSETLYAYTSQANNNGSAFAGYTGFVQPRLDAIRNDRGEITDVHISYPLDLTTQMLEYSGRR